MCVCVFVCVYVCVSVIVFACLWACMPNFNYEGCCYFFA